MASISTGVRSRFLGAFSRTNIIQSRPLFFATNALKIADSVPLPIFSGAKCNFHCEPLYLKFRSLYTATVCQNQSNIKCDKCAHTYALQSIDLIKVVTCPECGALQKIDPSKLPNYFQILGHEQGYKVDVQRIANNSKHLQKRFHPDLFSQKSSDQQNLSQEYSSLINKALSTLSDPIARGRYLLTLGGDGHAEGDLEKTMTSDPEFLEEVMELNERLEEISSENDWKTFRDENVGTMKIIQEELVDVFATQNLKEAQRLLARLKYYDSLQLRLKDLQSRIGVIE